MRPTLRAIQVCRAVPLALLVLAGPLAAQTGRRFSAAIGPAVVVDEEPPAGGIHGHVAMTVWPGQRPFNLLVDAHTTRLGGGNVIGTIDGATFRGELSETQVGAGLSLLTTLFPSRSISPYLLVGAVYRYSWFETRLVPSAPNPPIELDRTTAQGDLLLGGGVAIRQGTRRILLEVRLYGGTAIHLPVTVGLTF